VTADVRAPIDVVGTGSLIPDSWHEPSGRWYRARGWRGGRAPNKESYQRPDPGRAVSNYGRWYERFFAARHWFGDAVAAI
jgi:hypothetical protein